MRPARVHQRRQGRRRHRRALPERRHGSHRPALLPRHLGRYLVRRQQHHSRRCWSSHPARRLDARCRLTRRLQPSAPRITGSIRPPTPPHQRRRVGCGRRHRRGRRRIRIGRRRRNRPGRPCSDVHSWSDLLRQDDSAAIRVQCQLPRIVRRASERHARNCRGAISPPGSRHAWWRRTPRHRTRARPRGAPCSFRTRSSTC